MPRNWLSLRVELLAGGRGGPRWPPPGRLLIVGPRHTFSDLAEAVETAFARWDRAHLWEFTLADGRRVALPDPDDDEPAEDARRLAVSGTVAQGEVFKYVFDFGDDWVHRCTVVEAKVDPLDELGIVPDRPTPSFGWGSLPDQYGRRWEDDDGESPEPPRPADDDPMLTGAWPARPTVRAELTYEHLRDLRGATVRRDRAAVRDLLTGRAIGSLLQHAGDALLAVGLDGLDDLARPVERALRERGDEGDVELADVLAAGLSGTAPDLRPVPIDLDQVAELMNGDPRMDTGAWVDLRSGEIWPDDLLETLPEAERPDVDDDPEGWWHLDGQGSRSSWRDRHDFAAGLPSGPFRDRLLEALDGRGAFGRFNRALDDAAGAREQWRALSAERGRGRARAILAAQGYMPAHPPT